MFPWKQKAEHLDQKIEEKEHWERVWTSGAGLEIVDELINEMM